MGGRRTVSYTLRAVPTPPVKPSGNTTRVSALQRQVFAAAETPGQWFLVAQYQTRTGAYQGKKRLKEKDWPWPVVLYATTAVEGEDENVQSELYVKVLEVRNG